MRRALYRAVLHAARWLGLFRLAAWLTRGQIRILGYHGASLLDEHLFRPSLFMSARTFERRMRWLARAGCSVLGLEEALARRAQGTLPALPVVITVDDGWVGSARHMFPLLRELGLPATLYVPTAYVLQEEPVTGVMLDYLLWKSPRRLLSLEQVDPGLRGSLDLRAPGERERLRQRVSALLAAATHPEQRRGVWVRLGQALEVDYAALAGRGLCTVLSAPELAAAAAEGIDLQLHSHLHDMPEDPQRLLLDLESNRAHLAALTSRPLRHFCYPSGVCSPEAAETLAGAGVVSATTCVPGLLSSTGDPMLAPRLLDRDDFSQVEFQAELSGFKEVLRGLLGRGRRVRRPGAPAAASALGATGT